MLGLLSSVEVMDTILRDCAKLNSARGKLGDSETKLVIVRHQNGIIREYAKEIAECDFNDAVHKVNRESAHFVCKDIQIRYNESVYWDIIQSRASILDPEKLRNPKGPSDGFEDAEKQAAKEFLTALGLGVSPPSQQKYRRLWKNLANWRKSGVDMILFYRTKQFDSFCLGYPKTAKTPLDAKIRALEERYGDQIKQLEDRVMRATGDDAIGRIWLQHPLIIERVGVPEKSWDNASNPWLCEAEEAQYESSPQAFQAPDGLQEDKESDVLDQSVFVTLLPGDKIPLYVCPIVTIHRGDYLGIFSGNMRYSVAADKTQAVCGPTETLWLDYSQLTGVLNQMKVSPPNGFENVRLEWEIIESSVGASSRQTWRVAVRALETIKPFEELVRVASHQEQYLLHQEPAYGRKGFLSV